jgi:hypothetical protein
LEPAAGGAQPAAGGAAGVPAATQPSAAVARVRVAIDTTGLDPASVQLTSNGTTVPVGDDGFVEVPLIVGTLYKLAAQATRGGAVVKWEQSLLPTLNTESEPISAVLA